MAVESQIIQIGSPAPEFALKSLAGEVVALADFKGKQNVTLYFFRHFR